MSGTTRRTFLGGAGALGVLGAGAVTGGAAAGGVRSETDPPSNTTTSTEEGRLEAVVDDVMAERVGTEVPGASVAVVEGDDVVLAKGYGVADADTETPVRPAETTFEVGSVGKLVTWTAVLQGVQDGVLELDEDVNTYLDGSDVQIPDTYEEPVTLEHLGTHTAGFESALDPGVVDTPDRLTSLETVLVANRPERVRQPGTAVGYSNYGAALAGHVVAEMYDTTFEEYVQSKLFDPLEMTHSTFAQPVPDGHPGTLAASHTRDGGEFVTEQPVYINMWPAGSMTATATDLATFMSAHLGSGSVGDTRILESDTAATMYGRHYERHPAVNNWRYGFYEYGDPDADLIAHSGSTIYQESQLVLAPRRDVGVFVTYNTRTGEEASIAVVDEILAAYGLQSTASPPTPTGAPGSEKRAETVADEYRSTMVPESGPLSVIDTLSRLSIEAADDGRLRSNTLDGDGRVWVETDPYVYREREGNDVLAFDVVDGKVTAMHESSIPQATYEPVPFHERQFVTGGVIGGSLAGFVLSLLGWGGRGVRRRWHTHRSGTGTDVTHCPETGTDAAESTSSERNDALESDDEGGSV